MVRLSSSSRSKWEKGNISRSRTLRTHSLRKHPERNVESRAIVAYRVRHGESWRYNSVAQRLIGVPDLLEEEISQVQWGKMWWKSSL